MSAIRYELILLGPEKAAFTDPIEQNISERFLSVGLDFTKDGRLLVGGADEPNWGGFPVAVWFGGPAVAEAAELELMRAFLTKGFTLFPVVADLDTYSASVPEELKAINGQVWDVARTCSDVMKGFRLARPLRQVFISYKRSESSGVAHQLFHELNERGFRVFLDTASVEESNGRC
jgi:hypothetical protein